MTAGAVSRRGLLLRPARTFAQVDDDVRIVAGALLLERVAIASYDVAVAAARAVPAGAAERGRPRLPELLARVRDHEREHAEVLASKLEQLGGRAPPAPRGEAELARRRAQLGLRAPLGGLRTTAAIAAFALELEDAQLTTFLGAVRDLQNAALIELATQIMGAEGQHAVALRSLLSDAPGTLVPDAFERGEAALP
ncbi:ferritin-like domain-containing protein [Conexibacter arvalis]|uniref:Rubrerythrin n=1 Tax=Conexibacter arvalis TaxID=912552 RepID=A0A840IE53_9ACTN|nr:ferritin-like domain-containing protein [Conexibacter arvalis]MBB4662503.1 rubrerythrin [Conexibacter arvalis]